MMRNLIALLAVIIGMLCLVSVVQADAGRHSVDLHAPTIIASVFTPGDGVR
jgi:hypothetical protein